MPVTAHFLDSFFRPRSVAIIGASRHKQKLGYLLVQNSVASGYKGKIWPVNPEAQRILGLKTYPDLASLPDVPELAMLAIPAAAVEDVVNQCGQRGIKNLIIISAGFSETDAAGQEREHRLAALAARYQMRIIGPNCLGIMSPLHHLNLTFAASGDMPSLGSLAFISQSGALGTAWLDASVKQPLLGLTTFTSLGNKIDIDEADLLEYSVQDQATKAVLIYCEGLKNGRRFVETAKKITRTLPVVMLKSGTSSRGKAAIASHTGSLAGSAKAYQTALTEAGVLMVDTMELLSDVGQVLAHQPVLKGKRIAIITNAGGPGILATDAIETNHLELTQLYQVTKTRLKTKLPSSAAVNNPVDILGDAMSDRYQHALHTVGNDRQVDGVLVILTPQAMTEISQTAEAVGRFADSFDKPVVACFMGEYRVKAGREILSHYHVPNYPTPERAVQALAHSFRYHQLRTRAVSAPATLPPAPRLGQDIIQTAVGQHLTQLSAWDSLKLIEAYKIPTVTSIQVTNATHAVAQANQLGFPVVLKVDEPEILHKSDFKGVSTNIKDALELTSTFNAMEKSLRAHVSHSRPLQFLLQQQAQPGVELLIGFQRDSQFGPLMTFGLGGIYVEIFHDVSFALAPVSVETAMELLEKIQAYPLLRGARGGKSVDIAAVAQVVHRISHLALHHPTIKEFEINPLFARADGVMAVDARTLLYGE